MKEPEIYCKFCYVYQAWRNQEKCVHCGHHISNWHVAGQLQHKTDGQIGRPAPTANLFPKAN